MVTNVYDKYPNKKEQPSRKNRKGLRNSIFLKNKKATKLLKESRSPSHSALVESDR